MQSSRAFHFCTLLKPIAEGCKGLSVSSRQLPRKLVQHYHACYHEMLDCLLEGNPKDALGMPQFHQEGFRILLLSDESGQDWIDRCKRDYLALKSSIPA